jgi:S-adenosylmethionine/arginine decarboxylase-like enzyme
MTYNTNFANGNYGEESLFDFHGCDADKFTPESLIEFVNQIIKIADMEAYGDPIVWEDKQPKELHLNGVSVFQWIKTSNIVIHSLSLTGLVMVNLFSCKPFNALEIANFGKEFFQAERCEVSTVKRGV